MAENYWTVHGNAETNPGAEFLGTPDAQPLVLKSGGKETMRLDAAQNVGIGIEAPLSPLHVKGAIASGLGRAKAAGTVTLFAGDSFAWFHIDNGPAGSRPIGRLRISYGGKPGDHEIVSILQNETVGVGTDAPGAKLHIRSGTPYHMPQLKLTQSQANDFARLRFESFGTDPDNSSVAIPYPVWDLAAGTGRLNVYAEGAGNIMSFSQDGRVGIRTENPETALHVNGEATTWNLHITGGYDIAEPFAVAQPTEVEAGTVMVIDEDCPGGLRVSDTVYDKRVAGIVSGAGDLRPGLTLSQDDSREGGVHVALSGRVYCKGDATSAPIEPGDLLTTSDVRGHAQKAEDIRAAQGAILGKAMSRLAAGRGLVLVLVTLQ